MLVRITMRLKFLVNYDLATTAKYQIQDPDAMTVFRVHHKIIQKTITISCKLYATLRDILPGQNCPLKR